MKKILIIFVCFISLVYFSVQMNSLNAKEDIIGQSTDIGFTSQQINIDTFIDEKLIIQENEYVFDDNNNNPSNAVEVTIDNSVDENEIAITGNLYNRDGFVDYDYYSITLQESYNVQIEFSSSDIRPFYVSVYNSGNNIYTNEMYNSDSLSADLSFTTMYVVVYHSINSNYEENRTKIDYSINIKTEKLPMLSYKQTELRFDKGATMALWVSDLLLNLDYSLGGIFENEIIYDSSDGYKNKALDVFLNSSETKIKLAELYIWDIQTRLELSNIFNEIKTILTTKIDINNEKIERIELIQSGITGIQIVIKFAGKVLMYPYSATITAVSSSMLNTINSILNHIVKYIELSNETLNNMIHTINIYKAALETSEENKIDEVVSLPFYFSIVKETKINNVKLKITSFIDADDVSGKNNEDDNNLEYSKKNITINSNIISNNHYLTGKVLASNSSNSLDLNDFVNPDDLPHVSLPEEDIVSVIIGCDYDVSNLLIGEFIVFKIEPQPQEYQICVDYSNKDIIVEVFSCNPKGYSKEGLIHTFVGNYTNKFESNRVGTSFTYRNTDRTIYLKIYGRDYSNLDSVNLKTSYDTFNHLINTHICVFGFYSHLNGHYAMCECGLSIDENHVFNDEGICTLCKAYNSSHKHSYTNSYEWHNSTRHKSFCKCGEYILEGHAVRQGKLNVCLICDGPADVGFIEFGMINSIMNINNFIVLDNGIVILKDEYNLNENVIYYIEERKNYIW